MKVYLSTDDNDTTSADKSSRAFARPRFQKRIDAGYPQLKKFFAIPSIALTTILMAFSGLFPLYPIVLFYGLWLSRILYKGRFIPRVTGDVAMPLLFSACAVCSILWSDYPAITARAALEFVSMIVCTIIIARIVTVEALVKGLTVGSTLIMIITLISGKYGQDYFSGDYSLIGMFGSKNQVGLFAEIGIFTALLYLFVKSTLMEKITYSFLPLTLCTACLYLSRSGTALATLLLTLGVTYGAYIITRFAPHKRKPIFILGLFFSIVVVGTGLYLGKQDTLFHMMGKNATLTGRTYLWAGGVDAGLKAPVLGHGYYAFWVPGRIEAEKYWFDFGIRGRSGFHFHDLFIESFVELGSLGLLFIVYMVLSNCIKSFRYIFEHGLDLRGMFCVGISFMFFARAIVEVDFLGPFSIGCLLFFWFPRAWRRTDSLSPVDHERLQLRTPPQ